jgi:glycosyltransferase involved in cell wall biosynthesis
LSCVSQITLNNLKRYFPLVNSQKPITVIYNCVDFSPITTTISQKIAFKNLESFLLCVGQHRKNKNLDLAIEAYHKLRNENQLSDDTKLIIVGATGPETPKLQELIDRLNLQKLVLLESSLDDASLSWLYQQCQLFIIASSTEGFCLPLAEAIYFSAKVVCSDIPIFREIGADRCSYFQLTENSLDNLANAIADTLKRPRFQHNLDNYRFSKSKIADRYLEFYDRLI